MASRTDTSGRVLELSRDFRANTEPRAVMRHLARALTCEIRAVEHAAITTATGPPLGGDQLARELESCQRAAGGGPRLQAELDGEVVRGEDLARDPRWPEFAAVALRSGVRAVLAVPLVCLGEVGALTLYARRPRAFTADAEQFALLLAAQATSAAAEREQEHLSNAAASRDVIGQAKGILMERYRINAAAAFDLLSRISQSTNTKLRAVAEELTRGSAFPGQLPRPRSPQSTG